MPNLVIGYPSAVKILGELVEKGEVQTQVCRVPVNLWLWGWKRTEADGKREIKEYTDKAGKVQPHFTQYTNVFSNNPMPGG